MPKPATHRRARTAAATAALTAVLALTAACGSSAEGGGEGDGGGGPLRVGVLFAGSLSDDGFMESAHLGYERVAAEHGDAVELSKVEQIPAADYESALVRFATTSDLVISIGGQTDADVRKVAPQFPDVDFVEIGGPADGEPLANLALYDPQQAEAAFLSGAAAALTSRTGTVGFIGGAELPAIVNAAQEFENGARYAVPGIEIVAPQYLGDFNDVAKAKQAALADYGAGADVLGQVVNLGKQGIAQAAEQSGAYLIGGPVPHDCGDDPAYLGFVSTDIGAEIEYAVRESLAGTWEAESLHFGLTFAEPANDLVLCDADEETTRVIEEIKTAIATGEITTL